MLVMQPNTIFFRHAEQLILIGPVVEGFVGGLSTFNGVFHAFVLPVPMRLLRSHPLHFSYVTDCTRPGSRLDTTNLLCNFCTHVDQIADFLHNSRNCLRRSFVRSMGNFDYALSGIQLIFSKV